VDPDTGENHPLERWPIFKGSPNFPPARFRTFGSTHSALKESGLPLYLKHESLETFDLIK
jgi:hypothetical protein